MVNQPKNHKSGFRSIHLETFGCQMNELDSELVRGHLAALGYRFTPDPEEADIILYNTCSVREQAENKVLSRIGIIGAKKREAEAAGLPARRVVLGVIGCMAEREGPAMMRRFPQIDLMCGPGELDKLPMLLENVLTTHHALDAHDDAHASRAGFLQPGSRSHAKHNTIEGRIALQGSNARRSSTLAAAEDSLELLDLSRAFDPDYATSQNRSAYVRITRGCNKFCTYCVVPHTRGPEVHRPPDAIIDECKRLADAGIIEVTLLGQTVNHYTYTHGLALTVDGREAPQVGPGLSAFRRNGAEPASQTTSFADLLHRIHEEVPAIQRLRFVTSYPRDFGDDILHVMAASPRICRYLHVPAQSGSNRILKLMNRGYTVEQYMEFINRALAILPDVSIAGDIIVGFPTETDEDFEMTKNLLRRVPFKNNFIFKYSPRPGTTAIDRFPDDVPDEVKRRRNNELLALQSEISAKVHEAWIGRTLDVFVERISSKAEAREAREAPRETASSRTVSLTVAGRAGVRERSASGVQLSGRTGGDLIVVFDLPHGRSADDLIGSIVPVRITSAGPLILRGEL
ncbi:MAG TPA: MiaB/RimO family radical SAM methylthiotransferase [Phycisphaerales bacterium]|nr:MiaB/RimO family radical SAM methylthiotransferase [Phycisphaerales bacterium]HRQ76309.1 MiaB/RimO family radical SAM methylthiotransferase [Phycisphaerales bacterium]